MYAIEKLNQLKNELEEELKGTYALDFANEHDAESFYVVSDAISEFADSGTSVYYSDQRKYFEENTSECEDALTSIYNSEDIADYIKQNGLEGLICHAGALGEYQSIENDLYHNLDNVIKLLAVRYALENYDKIVDIEKAISNIDIIDESDVRYFEDIISYCFKLKEEDED